MSDCSDAAGKINAPEFLHWKAERIFPISTPGLRAGYKDVLYHKKKKKKQCICNWIYVLLWLSCCAKGTKTSVKKSKKKKKMGYASKSDAEW